MENKTQEPYELLYAEFMQSYSLGSSSSEEVGELVARLASFYPNYNSVMVKADRSFSLILRDEILKTDEVTGKAVSGVKAETMAGASSEAFAYKQARMHIQNLEMLINSAKTLQRGLIQEFKQSNLG
jgi:hypothetical protein